jgi:hypothetical protein
MRAQEGPVKDLWLIFASVADHEVFRSRRLRYLLKLVPSHFPMVTELISQKGKPVE